ncbi:beta-galactosidase [Flavobacterium glycines]|uniref:Beta-galactosidase n=1 Tax=Flavobacterium glycines TaxID=551990 RepID=A0A1B9DZA2_9FLAO|nr:beta-galactosidase [Flavobacterium glycines]OCB75014.1 beta-galactosidase [Flavobacterium glycines]GEL11308.1 beta-galactosidase [Flavobacterium glycines]SDJ42379.1 beta-galactosidase [Flavobacterium glycines]
MKLSRSIFILIFFISLTAIAQIDSKKGTFVAGEKSFLLNGKPFIVRAGEIHFPRIPREYWEHRIQMCKAMGMNTICIYLFWNFHEQQPGKFDFTGQKDVAEFVRLIQKNGMYCIVRPGPYACAEWDMGGLPWWLLKKNDIQVRTKNDPYFMERSINYLKQVGKQLARYQIQNGGNIIMVQVENEYGVFGQDVAYMQQVRDAVRASGFDKVQLFRCDWSSNFFKYDVDGVYTALNFGAGSNIDKQFEKYKEVYPKAPLMCSEYWTGWFDYWGRAHETRSVSSFIGSLKDMLDRNISCSLYMAHGGTSFGQWGGANAPPFGSMVASYDYNAPINEGGQPTDKFYAVRDLLKNYLNPGETISELPANYPVIAIPKITFEESASLFENLPKGIASETIKPMEAFDQGWGRILYRTKFPESATNFQLKITDLHDWANIYINGKLIGNLDRRKDENTIKIPQAKKGDVLDILVDANGRVNYGKAIIDRKGITEKVEMLVSSNATLLTNWEVFNFPVDYNFQKNLKFKIAKANGPAWHRATFNLDNAGDTYIDMSSWGKGMVWVNGYNIGRYWKIGPQQTLYMPGCWLKKGKNEIIILDLETPKELTTVGFTVPVLDKIVIDESLLHRKKGETLDLSAETVTDSGSFSAGQGWKEVIFNKEVEGQYFCFEALDSQNPKDQSTCIAELELIGADGLAINRSKWKIVYADSEEVSVGNYSAEKIFDQQESTLWSTAWTVSKMPHPHQVVVDLGETIKIKGFKYLPRTDKNTNGNIKSYRFYIKQNPFSIKN